jgi:predicted nucleic acid-binding protein
LAETPTQGLLDTCVLVDLPLYTRAQLPDISHASAISFAELSYGVALAHAPAEAAARSQALGALRAWLTPHPFGLQAADKYGQLAALVLASGRRPRPRRLDLMIAATAIVGCLPVYTANPSDFRGLESVLDIRAVSTQAQTPPAQAATDPGTPLDGIVQQQDR